MNTILKSLLVLSAFGLPAQAVAGARDQLTTFTKGLKGLDAHFEQRVFDTKGAERERSAGTVQLLAPRQFRWEYRTPSPQLILADGRQIWIYDPDLEQVTVRSQGLEEQSSPLTILIDPGEIDRQFTVSEAGKANGLDWLLLVPKNPDEAPFEKARLGFSAKGLVRMELNDSLGQRTVIGFSPWRRNPVFAKDLFTFTAPPGVDVVGDIKPPDIVTPIRD